MGQQFYYGPNLAQASEKPKEKKDPWKGFLESVGLVVVVITSAVGTAVILYPLWRMLRPVWRLVFCNCY